MIKNAAFDIISVITIWGLLNNSYLNIHINKKKIYTIINLYILYFMIKIFENNHKFTFIIMSINILIKLLYFILLYDKNFIR